MNNQPAARQTRFAPAGATVNLLRDALPDGPVPLDVLPGMTGSLISAARNQEIFGEGSETILFYKVVSGVVRVCRFLGDGRRQIDSFHRSGDMFGLEVGGYHQFSAEAASDCKLIAYRYRLLEILIRNNESFALQLALYAMRRVLQVQHHAAMLARRGAVEKVAIFLAHWAGTPPGATDVSLPISRQDIGDYLGLSMEAVSRTLTQLEKLGIVALPSARRLHIKNWPALRAFET